MNVFHKTFRKDHGLSIFAILLLSSLIGFLLWVAGVPLLLWSLNQGNTGSTSSQYHFIQKQPNPLSGLLGNQGFRPRDLVAIENTPGVLDLATLDRNGYQAYAGLRFPGGQFGTLLFLESLPDRFLDKDPGTIWEWEQGDDIPLLVGQEFINLYNFAFAPSQGFPPINADGLSGVELDFTLSGENGYIQLKGRIVGTSERYQTILVPKSFLDWSNETLSREIPGSTRVVINSDPREFQPDFLRERGYEISRESTRLNALYAIGVGAGSFLGGFSLILVILITLFNLRSLEVSLLEKKQEIGLLLHLGTPEGKIVRSIGVQTLFPQILGFMVAMLTALVLLGSVSLDQSLIHWLPVAFGSGILSFLLSFGYQFWSLQTGVAKHQRV